MLGAIAGDVIGSVYERNNIKTTSFPLFRADSRFTDDTVLTVMRAFFSKQRFLAVFHKQNVTFPHLKQIFSY